jgi:23S rRNA (guanosine2251-2'-O)-methyltransferase
MDKKIYVLAHNIRSMHNVGSIFRTCDGAGVAGLYLTGYTACPPREAITKTALGADKSMAWEYHRDPAALINSLKDAGIHIAALECTEGSKNLYSFHTDASLCLMVGNEMDGIEGELLPLADVTLAIPMRGEKTSLNVSVALGIAVYQLTS